jgi:hypothetical protein
MARNFSPAGSMPRLDRMPAAHRDVGLLFERMEALVHPGEGAREGDVDQAHAAAGMEFPVDPSPRGLASVNARLWIWHDAQDWVPSADIRWS